MGSGLSIIPGMVDYSKTDLRFPTSGQQAHDAQIIHLVLFIHSLEMFIFSLWGLTPLWSVTGERPVYEEVNEYIKFFNEECPAYALSYLTPKQYRERYAA